MEGLICLWAVPWIAAALLRERLSARLKKAHSKTWLREHRSGNPVLRLLLWEHRKELDRGLYGWFLGLLVLPVVLLLLALLGGERLAEKALVVLLLAAGWYALVTACRRPEPVHGKERRSKAVVPWGILAALAAAVLTVLSGFGLLFLFF